MFTRVVKVGGSLLDLPDVIDRMLTWLEQQHSATNVLLVGGGKEVGRLRAEFATSGLNERDAHWKCVEIMAANAGYLSNRMPGIPLQTHVNFAPNHLPVFFSPANWLTNIEPLVSGTTLPASWDVSSDSIAARLAVCVAADELVLLKSADPPSRNLQKLAENGFVDRFFPKLAGELPPWRIVNLRSL